MNTEVQQLLNQFYPDFNARNIEQIVPYFTADIDWPNGMTGGREIGHAAVRAYWLNQWKVINSQVTPISCRLADQKIVLEVHQLAKDMEGNTLSDSIVCHTYEFVDGKINRMDISEGIPKFAAAEAAIPA